jgi:NAD(P)-dependent dehydrogenase (short-subunit alcohol dehydrogenase family)
MENKKAYVITGPTSGIGYAMALELARHGTVVLVGRNPEKLDEVQKVIKEMGLSYRQKNQNPAKVYLELGFETLSHFSYAFKKYFGMYQRNR